MVEQFELDFMGFSESSQETQETHAQIALLKNAVDPNDFVLTDYVEMVVPQMLEEYTLRAAKGSTGVKRTASVGQIIMIKVCLHIF